MLKKHFVLFGIGLAMGLLFLSTLFYPGGSQFDAGAPGFVWRHNYLSNLLDATAVNGQPNAARPWAVAGILVLCATAAVFFYQIAAKIPHRSSSRVIRYAGMGAMITALFAATPLHDLAVKVSGTLQLLAIFYVTVFVFRTRLHGLKALSVLCLVVFYATNFVYYARMGIEWLPVLQKLLLAVNVAWILALTYGTARSDFEPTAKTPEVA